MRNCLDQVHANEQGVVSGHDPPSVHRMRVGLRRLRSAVDLFAKVIPPTQVFVMNCDRLPHLRGRNRNFCSVVKVLRTLTMPVDIGPGSQRRKCDTPRSFSPRSLLSGPCGTTSKRLVHFRMILGWRNDAVFAGQLLKSLPASRPKQPQGGVRTWISRVAPGRGSPEVEEAVDAVQPSVATGLMRPRKWGALPGWVCATSSCCWKRATQARRGAAGNWSVGASRGSPCRWLIAGRPVGWAAGDSAAETA